MMPRIAVEECQGRGHRAEFHVDKVADAKSEHVAVEFQTLIQILNCQNDMAEALLAGDEAGNRPRRMEWLLEAHHRAKENLARKAIRIFELHDFSDAARG